MSELFQNSFFRRLGLGLFIFTAATSARAMPSQVVLMRHAEKPAHGDHLSERGWERARALPGFFAKLRQAHVVGPLGALYAMEPKDDDDGSVRAIETLEPLSQELGLKIHSKYKKEQIKKLVDELRDSEALDNKTVVVAWEHKMIPKIARALGLKKTPEWKDIYDRVWILDFSSDGKVEDFKNLPQLLLPGDTSN